MEGNKPWVAIAVAAIGLFGSIAAAYVTTGRKFDDQFEELKAATVRLEQSSSKLTSDLQRANADLANLKRERNTLKAELGNLKILTSSEAAKIVQAGHLPVLGWGDPAWTLASDGGKDMPSYPKTREFRTRVDFPYDFPATPKVIVALSYLDASPGGSQKNLRIWAEAEKVNARGFELVLRTWDESKVMGVRVEWVAVG